jgi:hypothetical protein
MRIHELNKSKFLVLPKYSSPNHDRSFFVNNLLPIFLFFLGFVSMSPVLSSFGVRGIFSFGIVFLISMLLVIKESLGFKKWFVYLTLFLLITSLFTGFYWADIRYLFSNTFLILALFLIQFAGKRVLNKVIDYSSYFILVVLVLAVVGFGLASTGLSPLLDFLNPDGRANYFFYTTLSNSYDGNFIRPAGIYDEPGTLSLYACTVAALRHLTNKDNKVTWVILLLGFVTFSLAHLIYVVFHLLAEKFNYKNLSKILIGLFIAAVAVFSTNSDILIQEKLLNRLLVSDSTGGIKGDNRSFRMFNAIDLIQNKPHIIFFGADPSCRFDLAECKEKFSPMGENPLAPLVYMGLLVSCPYYIALMFLLLSPIFGKKYWVSFGFGLLLIQRPHLLSMTVAVTGVMVVYITLYEVYFGRIKKKLINFKYR